MRTKEGNKQMPSHSSREQSGVAVWEGGETSHIRQKQFIKLQTFLVIFTRSNFGMVSPQTPCLVSQFLYGTTDFLLALENYKILQKHGPKILYLNGCPSHQPHKQSCRFSLSIILFVINSELPSQKILDIDSKNPVLEIFDSKNRTSLTLLFTV